MGPDWLVQEVNVPYSQQPLYFLTYYDSYSAKTLAYVVEVEQDSHQVSNGPSCLRSLMADLPSSW